MLTRLSAEKTDTPPPVSVIIIIVKAQKYMYLFLFSLSFSLTPYKEWLWRSVSSLEQRSWS
jgi:hypothetical protein